MFGGKNIILAYHSLSETDPGKRSDCGYVSPRQRIPLNLFEKQLHWLSQFADFVSLSDIVTSASSDRWRVAVTFDDGYRDNIEFGLPLFRRYEVPVTWFLSTRFIEERDYLPWWDLVDYMMQHVHGRVEVTIDSTVHRYNLDEQSDSDRFRKNMREAFMTAEQSSYDAIYESLRKECARFKALPPNAFADRELVIRAASSPWISIGAHTVSHLNLASVSPKTVWHEVSTGQTQLQGWTGEPVDWFAYPYGGEVDYNKEVQSIVSESGFVGAVTTNRGYVSEGNDMLALPRFMVPSWAGMVGFKAGFLALNEVDSLIRNTGSGIDYVRRLLNQY